MQTVLKLIPTKLILCSYILLVYASYINYVLCVLRDKFALKWFMEGSILQEMATL